MTDEEKKYIFLIINDNDGVYSIAGLTMLIVTAENKQLNVWLERKKDFILTNNRISFNLKKEKDLLMLWGLEDVDVIQIEINGMYRDYNNLELLEKIIKSFGDFIEQYNEYMNR